LPDHVKTAEIWRSLVLKNEIRGVQVHDARLVAGMKAYGIGQVATYNGKDFVRYAGVTVLHPKDVV
jgi:predicted nucleic acid-binding protein